MWVVTVTLMLSGCVTAQITPAAQSPCGRNFGDCDKENGLCWGTSETTHYCTCKAGFRRDENSISHLCVDIDECSSPDICQTNGICVNDEGSYKCHCRCGYMLDYTGERCLLPDLIEGICRIPDQCFSLRRRGRNRRVAFEVRNDDYVTDENSLRVVTSRSAASQESCDCEVGFQRNPCGYCEDIDECAEGTHGCIGEGSLCRNIEGHYYCECEEGYSLCGRTCYGSEEPKPATCEVSDDVKEVNEDNGDLSLDSFWCDFLEESGLAENLFQRECRRSSESDKQDLNNQEKWGEWTCWAACKATCWGGLQTRTRKCHGGAIGVDCVGRGSEARECYSGEKCDFRVRKDATTLTKEEQDDLLQAMEKFRADSTVAGFHNTASSHGWPQQCNGEECCPHGARLKFLAWHRSTMLNYEKGLSRYLRDKTIGLPYWNWLAEDQTPAMIVWDKMIDGHPNPFANMTVRIDLEGAMRTIQRDASVDLRMMETVRESWTGVTETLMKPNTMAEFTESLESIHNSPHSAICRSAGCELSMGSIFYAAFDPIFMFHHTQIDRLWAVFQEKMEKENTASWTLDAVIETGEEKSDFGRPQMPFGNRTINPYPILKAVNNMRDSYYYTQLTGVVYDYLGNDGMPSEEPEKPTQFHSILIAHYLESFHGSRAVYVNYYEASQASACDSLREDKRVGGSVVLPTHRVFKNALPNLIPTRLDPREHRDISLKACYTDQPDCTSQCPTAAERTLQSMPSPILLHRHQESNQELFKFNWTPDVKLPSWGINFRSNVQFLYFYGSRANHMYRVESHSEWRDCDTSKAIPFRCQPKTLCKLPVGVYYVIDEDPRICRHGLRMMAVSTF